MKKLIVHLKEKPSVVRWVTAAVLVWPLTVTRYALMGVLLLLWVWKAPRVAIEVLNTIAHAASTPNEKRTPKESRHRQRRDDFDDVRVRISELTQSPKR